MKKMGLFFATAVMLVLFAFSASAVTEGDYTYTFSNGKATIIYVNPSISGDITLPSTFDGYKVTCIAPFAFENCENLTSVTIPNSVTTLSGDAFYGCSSLKNITIPDSVTKIYDSAFYGCSSLKSVTIPDSITVINSATFGCCSSLTHVIIPDSVISIGDGAFAGCSSLTNLTIPDSVTSIGSYAFSACSSLTNITIPDSVTTIDDGAFYCCNNLNDVYYTGTEAQWETITIGIRNEALTNATIRYDTDGCVHKNIIDIPQQNPTCTKVGYTAGKQCSYCKEWISGHKTIAKLGHSYSSSYTTDKKATLSANGSKSRHCTRDGCTAKTSVTAIARVSSFTLSTTNYVYNGKNKTPKVTVKDANGRQLVKNVDYKTWVASSRSNIGKYYVKVTLMGNYSGEKKVYFYIRPGVPTKLTATQSTTWVKLTWNEAAGAAGYSVYRLDNETGTYKKLKSTTALSYTDKELTAGTKYTYKVIPYGRSRLNNVYYSKSNIVINTATRTATPSISVTASGSTKAVVKWNNVSGENGYQVWYSTSKDGSYKRFGNAKANATSLTVTGLSAGKTYYFKVRTYIKTDSGYVYGSYSSIKSVKFAASTMPVPSITVTDAGDASVLVKWKDVSGESGYQVWYSTSKNGTYKKYSNAKANATSLTVEGLTEGKTYYFKVRTYKTVDGGYAYSDFSSIKSVKPAITPDYSEVLQEYRYVIKGYDADYYDYKYIDGSNSSILHYAYYDVNGDGVNELLGAEKDTHRDGYTVVDMFTYNDKPIPLYIKATGSPVWLMIYENGIVTDNYGSVVGIGSFIYNFTPNSLKLEFDKGIYYERYWENDDNVFYYKVDSEGDTHKITETEFNKIYDYYNSLREISPVWNPVIEPITLSSIVSEAKERGVNMAIASLPGVYGGYADDYDYHMDLWEDYGYLAEFPFIKNISESRFFVEGTFSGETFLLVPVNCKEVKIYEYKDTWSGEKGRLIKTMTDGKPFIIKGGYEVQGAFIVEVKTNDGKKITYKPGYSALDGSLVAGAPFYEFDS